METLFQIRFVVACALATAACPLFAAYDAAGEPQHAPKKLCFGGNIAEGNPKGAQACALGGTPRPPTLFKSWKV